MLSNRIIDIFLQWLRISHLTVDKICEKLHAYPKGFLKSKVSSVALRFVCTLALSGGSHKRQYQNDHASICMDKLIIDETTCPSLIMSSRMD